MQPPLKSRKGAGGGGVLRACLRGSLTPGVQAPHSSRAEAQGGPEEPVNDHSSPGTQSRSPGLPSARPSHAGYGYAPFLVNPTTHRNTLAAGETQGCPVQPAGSGEKGQPPQPAPHGRPTQHFVAPRTVEGTPCPHHASRDGVCRVAHTDGWPVLRAMTRPTPQPALSCHKGQGKGFSKEHAQLLCEALRGLPQD